MKNKTTTFYVDICLSYRSKKYVEGKTESAVMFGISEGLKKTGWTTDETDIDNAIDYQTHSTAIQFNLTVQKGITEKEIIKELSLKGLSVNIDKQ